MLLARLNLQVVQRIQVVLNLLKCGERGLAVGGYGAVVLREGNVGGCAAAAMIEERLGKCGPTAKKRLGHENQLIADVPAKPATAESDSVG